MTGGPQCPPFSRKAADNDYFVNFWPCPLPKGELGPQDRPEVSECNSISVGAGFT